MQRKIIKVASNVSRDPDRISLRDLFALVLSHGKAVLRAYEYLTSFYKRQMAAAFGASEVCKGSPVHSEEYTDSDIYMQEESGYDQKGGACNTFR